MAIQFYIKAKYNTRLTIFGNSRLGDRVADKPTRQSAPKTKSGLQKVLRLTSDESWKQWLQSRLVKPWWTELWNDCLKTREKGIRSVGLAEVQERMLSGEANGIMKYSTTQPDKEEWDLADHIARFIWNTGSLNEKSNEGVFYNRRFSEDYQASIMWSLKSVLIQMHSPSYINKPTGGTAILGTKRDESPKEATTTGKKTKAHLTTVSQSRLEDPGKGFSRAFNGF
ncbi:uncharacterized protein TRUGW13939_04267 [Talaromyces rugulosus]|uniref:Uncharacterized protein n=1 Tax=Talaromyces rugulosus TaxID=121627 RepID=A0A7H8QT94_TALRU|nr:uncharacterized protein TRUGW13939_04267 [Talaromyces rugulosus]QKX57159.1 hypothetical protein TRUGW13939_04267 [Talaromyces rugulosus]